MPTNLSISLRNTTKENASQMLLLFLVSGWVATEQVYTERTVIVPDYVPTLGPLRVEVAPEDEEPQPEPYQTAHAKAHPPHLPYQVRCPKSRKTMAFKRN